MSLVEAGVPYVKYRLLLLEEQAKWKLAGNEGPLELSEIDHQSKLQPSDPLDAFFDYNKMAIQFGFVSMFCAAFPLAPACALANNILEIRTDALKRLMGMQRPTPSVRAENIGAWLYIFELISLAAVGTNVGVLCFTSNRIADILHLDAAQQVWAFVIIEHTVLVLKLFMGFSISDIPEWVILRSERDKYMLKTREEIIWREEQEKLKEKSTLVSLGGISIKSDDDGLSSSPGFDHVGSGSGADYGAIL